MEVRKVFAATLEKMMRENENIVMLDADLAKAGGTFGLREIFPDRAFDVGIAEANMALCPLSTRSRPLRREEFSTR